MKDVPGDVIPRSHLYPDLVWRLYSYHRLSISQDFATDFGMFHLLGTGNDGRVSIQKLRYTRERSPILLFILSNKPNQQA
jgi:hypothetical protein